MLYEDDEFIFIGFDCAYRSLGWTILGYNPHAIDLRNVFCFRAGGVIDVLGKKIASFSSPDRARYLSRSLNSIASMVPISRAIIIIEDQKVGISASRGNQIIEAQITYHFTVVSRADHINIIHAARKNDIARIILHESRAKNYDDRKKQVRRAFVLLSTEFNFDACSCAQDYKHTRADLADSCVQIIAAITFCAKDIDQDGISS